MKFTQNNRIYFPQEWGGNERFFAFSPDGELIAVHVTCDNSSGSRKKNLFVYDRDGREKWSHRSVDRGERGVVFWADKYNLLVPGSDDDQKNLDGLKHYKIGSTVLDFPFANTALGGIGTAIDAVAERGDRILGHKFQDGLYCISNNSQIKLPNISFSEAYFSPDSSVIAFISFVVKGSNLLSLATAEQTSFFEEQFVCFLPNNQILFSKNAYPRTTFSILHLDTLEMISEFDREGPKYLIASGACSPDGTLVATCDTDGELNLWGLDGFSIMATAKLSKGQSVSRMHFSFDNRHLLTVIMEGNQRKEVAIWNIQ